MNDKLLQINALDNVLICCQAISQNECFVIAEQTYQASTDIALGHKVARVAIKTGDKVLRYGVSIGSATQNIRAGEHVHLHNMKSDYIASHTRQAKVKI